MDLQLGWSSTNAAIDAKKYLYYGILQVAHLSVHWYSKVMKNNSELVCTCHNTGSWAVIQDLVNNTLLWGPFWRSFLQWIQIYVHLLRRIQYSQTFQCDILPSSPRTPIPVQLTVSCLFGGRRNLSRPETVGDSEAVYRDGGSAQETKRGEKGDGDQPKSNESSRGTPASARVTMRAILTRDQGHF